jgi:hypothetical protein
MAVKVSLAKSEPSVKSFAAIEEPDGCWFQPPFYAAPFFWRYPVTVTGDKQKDAAACRSLAFGFCQNVVTVNVEAKWASGHGWQWRSSRKLPARDAAKDSPGSPPWYAAHVDFGPQIAECGQRVNVQHKDVPGVGLITWDDLHTGDPGSLKSVSFHMEFEVFLLQKKTGGKPIVKDHCGWSVKFRASIDCRRALSSRVVVTPRDNADWHRKTKTQPILSGPPTKLFGRII